jgi:predicted ester cyclase
MTTGSLTVIYYSYLQCLNERRWNGLGEFVCEELSYNQKPLSLAEYRAMLVADADAIPDLRYEAEVIVVDGDFVACRLAFRCTPRATFLGFEPTGMPVSFAEHVFYRFSDGKISEVWSLIDRDAIAAQIAE